MRLRTLLLPALLAPAFTGCVYDESEGSYRLPSYAARDAEDRSESERRDLVARYHAEQAKAAESVSSDKTEVAAVEAEKRDELKMRIADLRDRIERAREQIARDSHTAEQLEEIRRARAERSAANRAAKTKMAALKDRIADYKKKIAENEKKLAQEKLALSKLEEAQKSREADAAAEAKRLEKLN